ncbi:relaxase/mobilization nuclease domain-containing protein [Hominenteromicrobium sp.]|uniref:relaxase/mobilization nuclease domain-containing protein n=1 Tax=Hominenteromicrobium sp. TaxID=3073581 RepID=UPI003AB66501
MATTGFWPVKNRLKEVIDYARNPDKATDKKFLDGDLYAALRYVENDKKTDRTMYVSGINCPKQRAYEYMMTTKQRYGKLGGNVAYHGYQSFVSGEVTPGEAHVIGIETARRMWGKDYEIVVTTHLNTDDLHNHIVVNSVSFRTGRKFENHISDHYKLREISDEVCREYGKSVLAPSKFKGNRKKDYWIHKSGGFTHRDILKRDIDEAISKTTNGNAFELYLKSLGYSYARNSDYHPSIIAPGWKRPVRIDSLGEQYTQEKIRERLISNQQDITLYALRIPKRHTPLLQLEYEFKKAQRMDGMQLAFALIIELWKLITGNNVELSSPKPLSPMLRKEVRKLDQTLKEYKLLCVNQIDSARELVSFIEKKSADISALEAERQRIYNRIRRPKSEEEKKQDKAAARAISAKLKPLREELKTARSITERYPHILELLETERAMETQVKTKNRERNYER